MSNLLCSNYSPLSTSFIIKACTPFLWYHQVNIGTFHFSLAFVSSIVYSYIFGFSIINNNLFFIPSRISIISMLLYGAIQLFYYNPSCQPLEEPLFILLNARLTTTIFLFVAYIKYKIFLIKFNLSFCYNTMSISQTVLVPIYIKFKFCLNELQIDLLFLKF